MTTSTMVLLAAFGGFMMWRLIRMRPDPVRIAAAHAALAGGACLVDVRSPAEFQSGHLPGARNLPLQSLGGRMHEVGSTDRAVVVYCASGARSASAAGKFRQAGYATVIDVGAMRNLAAHTQAAVGSTAGAPAAGNEGGNRQQRRQQERQQRRGR